MMFFTRSLVALTLILAVAGGQAQELTIPSIDKVPRINRSSPRPPAQVLRTSAFILKFKEHPETGKHYVILTDHQEEVYLKPLYRLAKHREGTLLQVEDLNALATEQENRQDLQEKL